MGLRVVCSGILRWMLENLIGNNELVIESSFLNVYEHKQKYGAP